jgi:carbamoyltransferase
MNIDKVKKLMDYKVVHGRELCNSILINLPLPEVYVSDDIKIITVVDNKDNTLSQSKVLNNQIEFLYVDNYVKWVTKIEKIKLYLDSNYDSLPNYILYIDAFDGLIVNDIVNPKRLLDYYDCKILFNCESNFTHTGFLGHSMEYFIPLYTREFERYINLNMQKYNKNFDFGLNAGVFLGEKEYVYQLITETYNYMIDDESKGFPYGCLDDQCLLRFMLNEKFDYISVDFENIFCLWGTEATYLENWIGSKLMDYKYGDYKKQNNTKTIVKKDITDILSYDKKQEDNNFNETANISFYGSHNASIVIENKGEILLVLEHERFLNYKNSGIAQYLCPKISDLFFINEQTIKYAMKKYNIKKFNTCIRLNTDIILDGYYDLSNVIPANNYITTNHHESHAAGTFYQSPYDEAIVFSFDGGGSDGKFNIYYCTRETGPVLLEQIFNPSMPNKFVHYDLGFPYMLLAHYLKDIKIEDLSIGNLTYPGKLMGYASYGKVVDSWVQPFTTFYKSDPNGVNYRELVKALGDEIDIEFSTEQRLEGETAYNIAATSQYVFEECFLEIAKPYFNKYTNLPVCITGGCGLNILLNTRLALEFENDIFVAPDPNDCGIALGMMLNYIKPKKQIDSTYLGLELLDIDTLITTVQNGNFNFTSKNLNLSELVDDIVDGKIVGCAVGRAEHGPRALGNRSIICNPTLPNMKQILNDKVKNREWYRPFAPVVRLEDVSRYFEWNKESRWMSFCPKVKEEWRDKLAAITHIDGTARVQTVTREQNPWLYELLTKFKEKTGIGVLLNTSFNVDGKPILSTIKDAFTILEKTQMDALVIEDFYIKKQN